AFGIAYDGNVWVGGGQGLRRNSEYDVSGFDTGGTFDTDFGDWAADMAYLSNYGVICQVAVGGDNGIHCWDPFGNGIAYTISGAFDWQVNSQRGLAYDPNDDSFYVGGWTDGVIYHVAGLGWENPGEVFSSCSPSDGSIAGLGWDSNHNTLWMTSNSESDTI